MILCVCPNPAIDKYVWVENFEKGKVNRVKREQSFPGGKGVHVALGIKELGVEVALLGFWAGSSGAWVKQACESRGISCYGPEVEGMTRTCLTLKSNDEFNETELLGVGPKVSEDDYLKFCEDFDRLLPYTELVCLSGSWPDNTFEASYGHLITKANELDKKTLIDCAGNALLKALEKSPYAVHINHFEGNDLYNTLDPAELAKKITADVQVAAITCGAEGLYLTDGQNMVHALSHVDEVISTVGCGDSLMAGLAVSHIRGYNLFETARLAAACGAANCLREELGMFHHRDVDRLEKECKTRILNVS